MKITSIDSLCLRYAYKEGFTYAGGKCTGRLTNLVRVHTDQGAIGIGTAYSHPSIVHLTIKQQLEPLLIGKDPTRVEELWDEMYGLTRSYGRKGAAMSALGALDMAFWDLRGQAANQPIWQLLGGKRQSCEAYGSALLWKEPEDLAEEAGKLVGRGFRRVKLHAKPSALQ